MLFVCFKMRFEYLINKLPALSHTQKKTCACNWFIVALIFTTQQQQQHHYSMPVIHGYADTRTKYVFKTHDFRLLYWTGSSRVSATSTVCEPDMGQNSKSCRGCYLNFGGSNFRKIVRYRVRNMKTSTFHLSHEFSRKPRIQRGFNIKEIAILVVDVALSSEIWTNNTLNCSI